MKSFKTAIIALLFLCLTSEAAAQFNAYTLMRRGQVSQYDTSVNIHITEYRLVRKKAIAADTLIRSYFHEISLLNSTLASMDAKQTTLVAIVDRQQAYMEEKQVTINGLNKTAEACEQSLSKSTRRGNIKAAAIGVGSFILGAVFRGYLTSR